MTLARPAKAIEAVSRAKNSAEVYQIITKMVGDLSGVEVFGSMVLVGIYIRPERTSGGIIRPTSNVEEDLWQGKVGVVLKWGPDAFIDPEGNIYEQHAAPGDWCVFKVGDGWSLQINDYPCRLVGDSSIKMTVTDPNIVF